MIHYEDDLWFCAYCNVRIWWMADRGWGAKQREDEWVCTISPLGMHHIHARPRDLAIIQLVDVYYS